MPVTWTPVDKSVQNALDEAARGRLRDAILAEEGDEEHLQGVLRMLGKKTSESVRSPYSARHRPIKRQRLKASSDAELAAKAGTMKAPP